MTIRARGGKGSRAAESEYDRLAITIPRRIAQGVRAKAEAGEASSVSAYIAQAVAEKLERDDLRALLAEMAEESGPPTPEEQAWADGVLDSFRKSG